MRDSVYDSTSMLSKYCEISSDLKYFFTHWEHELWMKFLYGMPILSLGILATALRSHKNLMDTISSTLIGLSFGVGLGVSGMLDTDKIRNFLDITQIYKNSRFSIGCESTNLSFYKNGWDPSLIFVMGGGLALTTIFLPMIVRYQQNQ